MLLNIVIIAVHAHIVTSRLLTHGLNMKYILTIINKHEKHCHF